MSYIITKNMHILLNWKQILIHLCVARSLVVYASDHISWTLSVQFPTPIHSAAIGVNKNRSLIYTFGGYNGSSSSGNYPTVPYIYQFNGTHFKNIGSIPRIYGFHCFTQCSSTINDVIYFATDSKLLRYNTTSLNFESTLTIPFVDDHSNNWCLTSNNTHLFILESENCSSTSCINLQIYNIQSNSWYPQTKITRYTKVITAAGCGYYDGVVYGFGGEIFDQGDYSPKTNLVMTYNFSRNEWSILSQLKLNAEGKWNRVISPNSDGIFYILQGWGSSVDIFDANKMIITSQTHRLNGTHYMMTEFINEQIYVIGGICQSGTAQLTQM
eukprot:376475_1